VPKHLLKTQVPQAGTPELCTLNNSIKNTMTFADLTNSDKPVLVDFYADWCAPCRAMKPVLEDLKAQLGDEVMIYKIDVEQNQMIAERYSIRSIPTLILFKNGKPVWRKSGMASSVELQNAVASAQPS
jgi:thioredoxin 1